MFFRAVEESSDHQVFIKFIRKQIYLKKDRVVFSEGVCYVPDACPQIYY